MSRQLHLILLMTLVMGLPSRLYGWNDAGHMTIARIAWETLSDDERQQIVTILRNHPHLDNFLRSNRPANAAEGEWIFLRASVWSDSVRPPKGYSRDDVPRHPLYQFHRGPWHYVNFPHQRRQAPSPMPQSSLNDTNNVLKQLERSMAILLGSDQPKSGQQDTGRIPQISDRQNYSVRLTWLFHLVGDVHQPMHATTLVDPVLFREPPHSDQGGNKLAVRIDEQAIPKNLHLVWDEMYATDSRFESIGQATERITHDPKLRADQLAELTDHTTFRQWAEESYELAIRLAYQKDQLKTVLWDDFNSGRLKTNDIPVIPPHVLRQSQQAAERRIALAGYRLAAKLREILRASVARN